MQPPPLSSSASDLVAAAHLTPRELCRLWAFLYDAFICDHAPPKVATSVKLSVEQFVATLGDHGVSAVDAKGLFAAASTAGSFADEIGWEEWALGLLAFDPATPHEGVWGLRRAACIFRRYASSGGSSDCLAAQDFARLVEDARASAKGAAAAAAVAAAAQPFELLLGGGSAMEQPEFLRLVERQGCAAPLLGGLLRIPWSARADDSLDYDFDEDAGVLSYLLTKLLT